VVQANCFGAVEGVCVDTHVGRLASRLGLTGADAKDAVKVEQDLMRLYAREDWPDVTYLLISHGRAVCDARKPDCEACVLRSHCPSAARLSPARRATA
jgi:endonuclease-3